VTLVPTRLYFKDGRVKLEFAVGRGKNVADKRQTSKERDAKREIDRALKQRGATDRPARSWSVRDSVGRGRRLQRIRMLDTRAQRPDARTPASGSGQVGHHGLR
jgi:hypothetical protein